MPQTAQALLKLVEQQQVEFISLQFTDIVGMVKNVTIPVAQLPDCLTNGVWFDGSSIEGLARFRIAENDMFLAPDLDSYALIPWDTESGFPTARLICDVLTPDGRPFPGDPRSVLKRVLQEAQQHGFEYMVAPELEFFLFKTDSNGQPVMVAQDTAGYFDVSTDLATHIRRHMVRALQSFGMDVAAAHHEVEIGQHEIDLAHGPALRMADNVVTARTALKAVAQQHGLYASFMPKPIPGINGSGLHIHQSLRSTKNSSNLFYDADDSYNLSALARHFIAGQLAHAPGMCAVLAPLVNSYKRLVPGYEAPVYLSWGRTNRSALIRVPRLTSGRPQTARVELRCPDSACNPYLALAVMLKSGLEGIAHATPLHTATEEDLYLIDPRALELKQLPAALGQALDELQRDALIGAALGPHILERFVEAKVQEWNDYRLSISEWELARYLPTY